MLMYIMLAYFMLLTELYSAACLYNACLFLFVYFALDYCIVIIYTNALSWIILPTSIINLHHVQWFQSVGFLNFMPTPFLFCKGLCALWINST